MTTLTEGVHSAEFLLGEADDTYNRDVVTLASGQDLEAGTVLGKITVGTASAAAFAGNTGTGEIAAVTVSAGAKVGDYKLVIIEPASNKGNFTLEDPDGVLVGTGVVATEFDAGGLTFTVTDATDFIAGDGFTITVAAGSGKYTQFDQDAADGSQIAAGILFDAVNAAADTPALIISRDAEVIGSKLIWPSDIEAGEKAIGLAQLADIGIVVR